MDIVAQIADMFATGVVRLASHFMSPGNSFSPVPVLVTILLALIFTSRELRKAGGDHSLRSIVSRAFPARIFSHASAKRDYAIFILNEGVFFWFAHFASLAVILVVASALPTQTGEPVFRNQTIEIGLLSVFIILVTDFLSTFSHYLRHKIPFLWEFHKVHHSAEVLTPVTVYRRHPVELIVNGVVITAGTAIAILVWSATFKSALEPITIFGVNAGVFVWRMLFYNLRHSHIWIDYGPFWSRIFTSPAQHQLHHSVDPKHHDCNFGVIFAFWDILFGTLYVPKEKENITLGLHPSEMEEFQSIKGIYLSPFKRAFAILRSPRRAAPHDGMARP